MNKPMREGFVAEEPVDAPGDVGASKAEATPPPEPPREEWPIKVKLIHKALRVEKGEHLRELSFRQPTGGDINRHGMPVRIDVYGDVQMDERKMTMMMAALTGVAPPYLETMDPRDWASCAYRLRGFFLPDPEAW